MPSKNLPPLTGVRVLDFSRHLPGPYCTMILADLGAEVIKIEEPKAGDPTRSYPPFRDGKSVIFDLVNRNKKSVSLDISKASERKQLERLIKTSDMLIESFRPRVLKKFKLDYPSVRKLNPKMIYASLTGFGQKGPLSRHAGHDLNFLALSGLLDQIGTQDSIALPGFQIADAAGGLQAAVALLAALHSRGKTGRGRFIDVSLLASSASLGILPLALWSATGKNPKRGAEVLSGQIPCYQVYRTRDKRFVAIAALESKFWVSVCEELGRPDLVDKAWQSGEAGRKIIAEIQQLIRTSTLAEWEARFSKRDACVSAVYTVEEAQSFLRNAGVTPQAIQMSDFKFKIRTPAPKLGEHNDALLKLAKKTSRS